MQFNVANFTPYTFILDFDFYNAIDRVIAYIRSGDIEAMQQCMDVWEMKGDELQHQYHHATHGRSEAAIHVAARQNKHEVLALLLQRNVNINVMSSVGESPLYIALWADHLESVRLLLEHGADIQHVLGENWLSHPRRFQFEGDESSTMEKLLTDRAALLGIRLLH
jgi:hypothetical protein